MVEVPRKGPGPVEGMSLDANRHDLEMHARDFAFRANSVPIVGMAE